MTEIRLKRVYDDYDEKDGYRVLIDRLWPRGVKKEYLHYDLWAKDITPTPSLRMFFHENPDERWDLFVSKYKDELKNSQAIKDFIKNIEQHSVVTLLYASKDSAHNHAVILKDYLEQELKNN